MSEALRKIKEQIASHEKKSPAYQAILVFYEKIIEAQEAVKPSFDVILPEISEELRAIQTKEGFPLINPNDFVIDIRSSVSLFESVCHIAKNATEKMRINIQAMEEALAINALNLREILRKHSDESYLNAIAKEFDIDIAVLKFLIHTSIQPSVEANVEKLKDRVDLKNWLKGYCPVCGSSPLMSGLRGEGQRYFLCSFCGFLWPGERIKCPFCENRNQKKLHYFYEEGCEAYRVDLCDNCKQYVKTVDARKLGYEPDLNLEDITTVHLDILASQKGFKRPAPGHWAF
jgi:FdhE protein